jgi:subtilase family serine protease
MRARLVAIALVLALVVASLAGRGGGAEPSLVPDALHAQAASRGTARVIIRLNTPYQPESTLASAAHVTNQRQTLAGLQSLVRTQLRGIPHRVVRDFGKTLPLMAIEASPDALRALGSLRGIVAEVVPDGVSAPTLAQSIPLIHADEAWAAGFDGTNQIVAILDTGVQRTHPFLGGRVIAEACFSSATTGVTSVCPGGAESAFGTGTAGPCAVPGTACNHGTHVAGIAAGSGASFSGVAKNASIIAIQVFSRFNDDSSCGGPGTAPCALSFDSDQIEALNYVNAQRLIFNGKRIAAVNMSLGGGKFTATCPNDSRRFAIDQLRTPNPLDPTDPGVATVVSAGNNGYTDAISAPACNVGAVPVASSTKSDVISSFSNIAALTAFPRLLVAPGSSITSSYPTSTFAVLSGTSMAAPHVTGTFAVLRQVDPTATVEEILSALQASGKPILDVRGPCAGCTGSGVTAPRIDVAAAAPPNLVVQTLTAPNVWLPGTTVNIMSSVRNNGIEPAVGSVLRVYLSTDAIITTSDTLLATVTVPPLDGGAASSPASSAIVVPSGTTPGAYFLGAIADAGGAVAESSETDNTRTVAIQVVRPDLTVPSVTFTPAASAPGLDISVTHTIRNLVPAPATAPASVSGVYLASRTTFASVVSQLGIVSAPAVSGASASSSITATRLTIPAGTPVGRYFVLVRANETNAFVEETTANNVGASTGEIIVGPDLLVTAASTTATSIVAGGTLSVAHTVKNQGGQSAPGFDVGFVLVPQNGDPDIPISPARSVPGGLAAGATSALTSVVSIPTSVPAGAYKVRVIADRGNTVHEADEANNTLLSGIVNVMQADLAVSSVIFTPAATRPGGNITVTHVVKNLAAAPATAGPTLSRLRLGLGQVIVAPDVMDLGTVNVPALAAGGMATVSKSVQLPASMPPGVFYLSATADDGGAIAEGNESNNTAYSLTRLIVGFDTLPTAASTVASAGLGTNVSVTYTIKNQGGAPAPSGGTAVLSLVPQSSGSPIGVGFGAPLPAVDPGASTSQTTKVLLPSFVAAGSYRIRVQVQVSGDVDLGNNTILTGPINLVTADFAMQSVTFTPAAVAPGGNVTVVQTIKNVAAAPGSAGASTSRLFLSLNQGVPTSVGELGLFSVPPIAAGATASVSTPLVIPGGTAPGRYYVAASANHMGFVPESHVENNLAASLSRLVVGPDIVPTAASTVATIAPGKNLSVSYTLRNQGGAPTGTFDVGFAMVPVNATGTPIGGDIALGTRQSASIAAGATRAQTASFAVPNVTGLHRIRIIADPGDLIAEADESNNTLLTNANLSVGAPDLVVPPFTFSPAVSAPGGAVTIHYSIKNQAPAPGDAATSASRLFLSVNQSVSGEVASFGTASVPPIPAGMTVSGTRAISLPPDLSPGYYYFGTVADPAGQIFESNETNNVGFTQGRILVGPDLLPTAATTVAATTPGANVSVTYTIKNQGGLSAGNFSVGFTLVPVTAAGVPTGPDVALGSQLGVTVAAGATQSATGSFAIPDVPTPGLYRVRVTADAADQIPEADETNNTLLTTGVISIVRPDLAVQSVTATPTAATTGTVLTVSHVVKNLATAPGNAGPTTTSFFLDPAPSGPTSVAASGDPAPPAVTPVFQVAVPAIAAGGTVTVGRTITVPGVAPGKYVITALVNASRSVVESDSPGRANNVRSTATSILIGPDLTMTAVTTTPAALTPGANVSVMNTVKNQGAAAAGAFDIGFYLSSTNVLDGSAVLLTTRRVLSLSGGAVSTATTPVRLPSNQSAGSYFVLVRADSGGEVIEADEDNNVRATASTISVVRPDLIVTTVTATPAVIAPGANISVTHTVRNIAPAAGIAPATVSRLYLASSASPVIAGQPVLGDVSVPPLAGGATATVTRSIQVPAVTAPGKYWIIADANATDAALETSSLNAQVTTSPILVGPDLLMTTLTAPLLVSPNLTVPVTTTVKNQGGQGTNGSVVRFFLSLSGVLDGSQVPIGVTSTAALAPAASYTTTSRLTIPGNTIPGGRFLLTQVDGGIPEADLANNVRLANFNVNPPQLQVVSITAPAAAVLGRVTGAPSVSVVIKNVAGLQTGPAAPFDVRVYANRDDGSPTAAGAGAGDLVLSKTVPALVPGATITITGPLVVPLMVGPDQRLPGSYFVSATADASGTATGDLSLGDNVLVAPKKVTVTAP